MTRTILPNSCCRQCCHCRHCWQGSSHHNEDVASGCDTVPPDESLEDPPPAAAPTPPKSTDDSRGSDIASVQQGNSCTFTEYLDKYDAGFELRMAPLDVLEGNIPQWVAVLEVKSRDVPRLMREGFFWSSENVLREEGYISRETRREWTDLGFHYTRMWILADKSNDETPQWVGHLGVFSESGEILPGFRVQSLSRENVHAAWAWNRLQQATYAYDCRQPRRYNYNCIYDDKPLQGWWPWPREEGTYEGFSALAMDEEVELCKDPRARRCQPHKRQERQEHQKCQEHQERQEPDQEFSGCVIL